MRLVFRYEQPCEELREHERKWPADFMEGSRGDATALLAELRGRPILLRASWRRDPRTVPTPIHRNATAEASCFFYGVADALTGVRYARSCQDCLETPGCALTLSGYCVNATTLRPDVLQTVNSSGYATSPGQPVRLTSSSSAFFAENTTYCASSDQACVKCHELFTDQAATPSTRKDLELQFCLGDDGCVCTGVCEVPDFRATRVVDYANGEKTKVFKSPHGPTLHMFSSRRRDPRSPLPRMVIHRKQVPEVCKNEPEFDVQGCHRPRTADECLKMEGCMVWRGQCSSQEEYKFNGDYRNGTLHFGSVYEVQFTSTNTTICNGPACADCARDLKTSSAFTTTAGARCYGTDGCVCSDLWDMVTKSVSTVDTECAAILPHSFNSMWIIAILIGFFVVVGLAFLVIREKRSRPPSSPTHRTESTLRRNMIDVVPRVPQLDLFGWRRFYTNLREKEQLLLLGAVDEDVLSPVAWPETAQFEVVPTAPDLDDEVEVSAPTRNDPNALASAPVYGIVDMEVDLCAPSAPAFDEESLHGAERE